MRNINQIEAYNPPSAARRIRRLGENDPWFAITLFLSPRAPYRNTRRILALLDRLIRGILIVRT
jgi:hypothetical protein